MWLHCCLEVLLWFGGWFDWSTLLLGTIARRRTLKMDSLQIAEIEVPLLTFPIFCPGLAKAPRLSGKG